MGSGGGARGSESNCGGGVSWGRGGPGGAIIIIFAYTLDVRALVTANGALGTQADYCHDAGGNGDGAGGSIWITAKTMTAPSNSVVALGLSDSDSGGWCGNSHGGPGGLGRVRFDFGALNGNSFPATGVVQSVSEPDAGFSAGL